MERNNIVLSEQCTLNLNTNTLTLCGEEKPLDGLMGKLIYYLATNKGQVLTRDQICEYVYQDEYYEAEDEVTLTKKLNQLLYNIRRRLGEEVRNCIRKGGGGYYFQPPTEGMGHFPIAELHYAQGCFLGRTEEQKEIHRLLDSGHKPIVIWGNGGIGKTELAINFAKNYLNTFKCHFVRYHTSIKDTIAGMSFTNTPDDFEKLPIDKKFEIHLNWLKECDNSHLLILDNYDDENKTLVELLADKDLARLFQLRMKLIITTRNTPTSKMPNTIQLNSLPEAQLIELIKGYYQRWATDGVTDTELKALIRALDGHTLCCELAAKTLQETHPKIRPKDITAVLCGHNNDDALAIVDTEKDRCGYSGRITDHIRKLYTISSLSPEDKETMRYMLLTAPSGIDRALLLDMNFGVCKESLQALINKGWLSNTPDTDLLTIHPVIRSFCILTPELYPTLIEEKVLDFIDNIFAFAGSPAARSSYFCFNLHAPYEEWRNEEKSNYRQWKQVENMTHFLLESVEQMVPIPASTAQAKSYFDYVDTFLNGRQERHGPIIPWEAVNQRYFAWSPLGAKLAFHMRQLAFVHLQNNLPDHDMFWGKAYDHLGRSYSSLRVWSAETSEKYWLPAKDCFEKALNIYSQQPLLHIVEIVNIYDQLCKNPKVDQAQKLNYALSAITQIDKNGMGDHLYCAMFCKQIAWCYSCVTSRNYDAALRWLLREEQEYLSAYVDIADAPSIVSMRASQKNRQLADVYSRIAGVHFNLNNREKYLEFLVVSLRYTKGLIEKKITGDLINTYLEICRCQRDLLRYSDCIETCNTIIESVLPWLTIAKEQLLETNNPRAAESSSKSIDRYEAWLVSAYAERIGCYCKLRKFDEAIVDWVKFEEAGLHNHPTFCKTSPRIYANVSVSYSAQKNYEKQYEYEMKALESKKENRIISLQDYLDGGVDIAHSLIGKKSFSAASDILLRVISVYDEFLLQDNIRLNPSAYTSMAQCLQKLGDNKKANTYLLMYAEATEKKLFAKVIRWRQKLLDK